MKKPIWLLLPALLAASLTVQADPVNAGYAELIDSYRADYGSTTRYAFYDINEDTVEELIIAYGESSAERMNVVFTRIGSDTFECGTFGSECLLYAPDGGQGLIAVHAKMGWQQVLYLTISEDELNSVTLMEGDIDENSDDYFSTDTPVEWLDEEITEIWSDTTPDDDSLLNEDPEFPQEWYKTHDNFILEGTAHLVQFDYNDGGYFHLVVDGVNRYTFEDYNYEVLPRGGGIVYHATTDYHATLTLIPGSEYKITLSGTGYDGVCWEED